MTEKTCRICGRTFSVSADAPPPPALCEKCLKATMENLKKTLKEKRGTHPAEVDLADYIIGLARESYAGTPDIFIKPYDARLMLDVIDFAEQDQKGFLQHVIGEYAYNGLTPSDLDYEKERVRQELRSLYEKIKEQNGPEQGDPRKRLTKRASELLTQYGEIGPEGFNISKYSTHNALRDAAEELGFDLNCDDEEYYDGLVEDVDFLTDDTGTRVIEEISYKCPFCLTSYDQKEDAEKCLAKDNEDWEECKKGND